MANCVHKIHQHPDVQWNHVPTAENPADLGSRGGSVVNNELWQRGPKWLFDSSRCPQEKTLEPSVETKEEAKIDQLLSKHELWKALRVGAWVRPFIHNNKTTAATREAGPLTTPEIENQKTSLIKRAQPDTQNTANYKKDPVQLNLQPNHQQILECRGRLEGEYPIYLQDDHPFISKLVHQAHLATLHGGVGLAIAKVREMYCVPRLRRLVKKVWAKCWGCKRFRTKAFQSPPPGNLSNTRTQGDTHYQVIGVDFAGPIRHRTKSKAERKTYLALYGCSLTRGVYLDLLPSLEMDDFVSSLKRFISRRGRPRLIYSDNGSTFKAAAKWLKNHKAVRRSRTT